MMGNEMGDSDRVPFEEQAVKEYLDECIRFWRTSDDTHAEYYVDAFQSVRTSLFGRTLPMDR